MGGVGLHGWNPSCTAGVRRGSPGWDPLDPAPGVPTRRNDAEAPETPYPQILARRGNRAPRGPRRLRDPLPGRLPAPLLDDHGGEDRPGPLRGGRVIFGPPLGGALRDDASRRGPEGGRRRPVRG